jgi:hypothetical protein
MREMYDEGMARKDCFERIAEELGGSWTARKVSSPPPAAAACYLVDCQNGGGDNTSLNWPAAVCSSRCAKPCAEK